eukprot:Nk52_evm1s1831 gene=Nk52_evmTU1s1831
MNDSTAESSKENEGISPTQPRGSPTKKKKPSTESSSSAAASAGAPRGGGAGNRVVATVSCVTCKIAHRACTGGRPCERCVRLGLTATCRDTVQRKRGPMKKKSDSASGGGKKSISTKGKKGSGGGKEGVGGKRKYSGANSESPLKLATVTKGGGKGDGGTKKKERRPSSSTSAIIAQQGLGSLSEYSFLGADGRRHLENLFTLSTGDDSDSFFGLSSRRNSFVSSIVNGDPAQFAATVGSVGGLVPGRAGSGSTAATRADIGTSVSSRKASSVDGNMFYSMVPLTDQKEYMYKDLFVMKLSDNLPSGTLAYVGDFQRPTSSNKSVISFMQAINKLQCCPADAMKERAVLHEEAKDIWMKIQEELFTKVRLKEYNSPPQLTLCGRPIPAMSWDSHANILFANETYCELLGFTVDEVFTKVKFAYNTVHPNDRETTSLMHLGSLLSSTLFSHYETIVRIRNRQGFSIKARLKVKVIRDESSGEYIQSTGTCVPI